MKIRLQMKRKPQKDTGPGTKAKAKLQLIEARFFGPGEEGLQDIMRFGDKNEDELENPVSVMAEDLITKTLGFNAIADTYKITPRNMQAWERRKMALALALQKDPEMEESWTKLQYNACKRLYEHLKGRSVDKGQINVEVVEQEPYVVQVPVSGWRQRPDDQRLE